MFLSLSQPPFVSYLSTFSSWALWVIWFLRFIFSSRSTRQPWVLGYHFWISGSGLSATGSHFGFFFVLVSGDFTALDIGIVGCTVVSPLPFPSDETKVN